MSDLDRNDLSGFVGKQIIYTYDTGWTYEMYVKNQDTLDYRVHNGIVGGRWVKDQKVFISRISEKIYKISWAEPTGTSVSIIANFQDYFYHGTIFFPQWLVDKPQLTACYQNEHLHEMIEYREAGPAYPTHVINTYAQILVVLNPGPNNEGIISCGVEDLPKDYLQKLIQSEMQ